MFDNYSNSTCNYLENQESQSNYNLALSTLALHVQWEASNILKLCFCRFSKLEVAHNKAKYIEWEGYFNLSLKAPKK